MDQEHVEQVCREMIRQWRPLIRMADQCSMLLWIADGSEIMTWNGDYDTEIEWARYVGMANEQHFGIKDPDHPMKARIYTEHPAKITYRDLKRIVATFKRLATEEGFLMQVGATFDPGPEFVYSDFKYKSHAEIHEASLGGKLASYRPDYKVICPWSKLNEDSISYSGFPSGIPAGTTFGRFLGRQSRHFLADFGFDYIWFSNGFGFSYFPWTYFGSNFDGQNFNQAEYRVMSEQLLSFWDDFKAECPDYRIEVRGTNFSTGMELAKDFFPLRDLYARKYLDLPPPNSPWGALNRDFGLEWTGYMSRIAELPGETFPFRFYANDPWFWQNPWWDAYDREAYDIYGPLSIGRMNGEGQIENPGIVEILTIDTEKGELIEACPMEIIPHLAKAIKDFPDRPGIVTWVYPFDENVQNVEESPVKASFVFFDEWFVRNAMNQGFPLNTVISTANFQKATERNASSLLETILLFSASLLSSDLARRLVQFVKQGGKILIYGPVSEPAILEILNIRCDTGISGELQLNTEMAEDTLMTPRSKLLKHEPHLSGGPIHETIDRLSDEYTKVRASVSQDDQTRVYALSRALPEWKGGTASWIRGTLAFDTGKNAHLPVRHGPEYMDASILARYLLADLGYMFLQHRLDDCTIFYQGTRYQEHAKPSYCLVSRHDNAYFFSGYKPDTTTTLQFRFPQGMPLLIGQSAIIDKGCTSYALDGSFHKECRVFIEQAHQGFVACKEGHPIRTRKKATNRSIVVTGLKEADVTILPPMDAWASGSVEVSKDNRFLPYESNSETGSIRLSSISGTIEITW
jgi:hypothetical protein